MSSTRPPKRQSFHYDSDDGLMDEIEKITAPPGKTFIKVIKEEIVSQKNWKSVNAQYCIVCREGGELLCCDTCPASFHLICHEPVIYKDEIPAGKWMCNRCSRTPSHLLKPLNEQDPNETEAERNRRAARRVVRNADSNADPLDVLAQAALAENAQQFELPPDYEILNVPFDFIKGRKTDVFDKKCNACREIVDEKPMTKCDFCDGYYHLDCLNPPLCSQPKGKWMCPNHVQPIVENKLLKSSTVFERKKLWDEHAFKKLDEISVISEFLSKAKRIQQKYKHRLPRGISKWKVKDAVKEMYKRRYDGGETRIEVESEADVAAFLRILSEKHKDIVEMKMEEKTEKENMERLKLDVKATLDQLLKNLEKMDETQVRRKTVLKKKKKKEIKNEKNSSKLIALNHPNDLYKDCMERLRKCQDPKEKIYLAMAFQRLEQLRRQTVVVKKGRYIPERKYLQREFLPDYPIMAILKTEDDVPPIAIQRTVTTIGYSSNCVIQLGPEMSNGRVCAAHGAVHANIVFDKISRRFELIPTGCSQVTVDGIVYGSIYLGPPCSCYIPNQTPVDMPAPLRHGSSIAIGCSRFVFASFY